MNIVDLPRFWQLKTELQIPKMVLTVFLCPTAHGKEELLRWRVRLESVIILQLPP